jgi:hypothetical protein
VKGARSLAILVCWTT